MRAVDAVEVGTGGFLVAAVVAVAPVRCGDTRGAAVAVDVAGMSAFLAGLRVGVPPTRPGDVVLLLGLLLGLLPGLLPSAGGVTVEGDLGPCGSLRRSASAGAGPQRSGSMSTAPGAE